jgi:hypothetical protein
VAKPVTAENSGHSNNQLIFNLLNTPILRKMDSSDCFRLHTPPPNVISQAGLTLTKNGSGQPSIQISETVQRVSDYETDGKLTSIHYLS